MPGSARRSSAPRSSCANGPARASCTCRRAEVGTLFRNPTLAATYRRILDEARGGSREEEIEKARRAYYEGFVAEEIDRFVAAEGGLLTGDDMARWRASLEPVASLEYGGLTVCKTLPWAAGPVGLQQLALLDGFDLAELSPAEFVHVVTECAKLAFADRDALYGDAEVPLETLLSPEYNAERRALVGDDASPDYTPGLGRLPTVVGAAVTPGAGEPTRGDTVHLDVVDRWGNMISATPSGGWLHSSPVIPALGWPLGTRAQMFWLEEGLPSSLRPGARPRTTLCPGLALRDGKPYLAWGTPGGDQQEQWALHVFLRHVDLGAEPAGGDRRAGLPHGPPDLVVLPARLRPPLRHRRVALRRRGRGGPPPPRARGRGVGPVDARPRHRGCARGGRPAESRREPARHAGLRGRAVGRAESSGRVAILDAWSHRVT